jgi:hypothetical protein
MRRLISIAALALLLSVPVWAQRGGHGGGGHVGGGMRGGAHFGGAHSFSGTRSGGVRSGSGFSREFTHSSSRRFTNSNRGFTRGSLRDHGFRGHRHDAFSRFGFRANCFGFGCGWGSWSPWWGASYYDPWVWSTWDDEDRRFDEDYYRQYELADRWNQQSLEEQRMLRQEEEDGDQDAYAPLTSNRHASTESYSQAPDPIPATVIVFRDQHKQEVQNYAIVGQTLWAFSSGRTQKIPLSDLDVSATEKANDDRGVAFRAPTVNPGQ